MNKALVPSIAVAISNVCDLNCPMCCSQDSRPPSQFMTFSFFRKIIKEIKSMSKDPFITLHNVNEPFLHPDILKMLNYLESQNVGVWISSNGQSLCKFIEKARKANRVPKRIEVRYSIDGGTKETYEEMRRKGSFEKLLLNLRLMKEFCEEKQIEYIPKVNTILSKKTAKEVGTFYSVFKEFFKLEDFNFSLMGGNSTKGVNEYIASNSLTGFASRLPCSLLTNHLSVHADGKISFCCNDFNDECIVAKYPDDGSLLEIWNSSAYETFRQAHLDKNVRALPQFCIACKCSDQVDKTGQLQKNIRGQLKQSTKSLSLLNNEIYLKIIDVLDE